MVHGEGKQRFLYKNLLLRINSNENVDKQSLNTHVEVSIFARQKSKDQSRIWIVQNNLHIAETYTKGTST